MATAAGQPGGQQPSGAKHFQRRQHSDPCQCARQGPSRRYSLQSSSAIVGRPQTIGQADTTAFRSLGRYGKQIRYTLTRITATARTIRPVHPSGKPQADVRYGRGGVAIRRIPGGHECNRRCGELPAQYIRQARQSRHDLKGESHIRPPVGDAKMDQLPSQ